VISRSGPPNISRAPSSFMHPAAMPVLKELAISAQPVDASAREIS
jgi:hypothetical protein